VKNTAIRMPFFRTKAERKISVLLKLAPIWKSMVELKFIIKVSTSHCQIFVMRIKKSVAMQDQS
jgi:hypothetical protein